MTIVPPSSDEPRRPSGPRNPGDAWVIAPSGEKYWGRFGAAGLLAVDAERGILLQHRVGWSHFGGTWGLPGGALHEAESALIGAQREAREEAGVPEGAVRPRFTSVLDLQVWSYTTVVADVQVPFEPVISDPESVALEWVPLAEVDQRPLHPGFGAAWPRLRALLEHRPVLVVDAANVVGSVPDGWWKDRAGAAGRLLTSLRALVAAGIPADDLDLDAVRWFPDVTVVVEGAARAVESSDEDIRLVRADGSGDDAILVEVERLKGQGRGATVVTSDRGLRDRIVQLGARTISSGRLVELMRHTASPSV